MENHSGGSSWVERCQYGSFRAKLYSGLCARDIEFHNGRRHVSSFWQRTSQDDLYEAQDQWPVELRRARVVTAIDYIQEYHRATGSCISVSGPHTETCSTAENEISIGSSHYTQVAKDIHEGQYFRNKEELMMEMRKWTLDCKFDFRSMWLDRKRVVLGCVDVRCSWKMCNG